MGLLSEKNEIEKLQKEFKKLAETNFIATKTPKNEIPEEELVLEEYEV